MIGVNPMLLDAALAAASLMILATACLYFFKVVKIFEAMFKASGLRDVLRTLLRGRTGAILPAAIGGLAGFYVALTIYTHQRWLNCLTRPPPWNAVCLTPNAAFMPSAVLLILALGLFHKIRVLPPRPSTIKRLIRLGVLEKGSLLPTEEFRKDVETLMEGGLDRDTAAILALLTRLTSKDEQVMECGLATLMSFRVLDALEGKKKDVTAA